MYGLFDWRSDYTSRPFARKHVGTEQEWIDSLPGENAKRRYLTTRANREKKWYASRWYQRSLRMTLVELRLRERQRLLFLKKRFKSVQINDVEIPANVIANIALLCYENGIKE